MITDEQIHACLALSRDTYGYDSDAVVTIKRADGYVTINAKAMYAFVPLKFATMKALSDLFETTELEEPDKEASAGCESCDYGSCYEWTLRIKEPVKVAP